MTLPDDLIAYLKEKQRQNRPLCPRCGRRRQEDPRTGWCNECTREYDEKQKAKRRRWWHNNRGRDREE